MDYGVKKKPAKPGKPTSKSGKKRRDTLRGEGPRPMKKGFPC